MSWLWGSSSDDAGRDSTNISSPKEEVTYTEGLNHESSSATTGESTFGSFSDGNGFGANDELNSELSGVVDGFGSGSDAYFSSSPGASFLPPLELNGDDASRPTVNFDAMGSISAGTVSPAFNVYGQPANGGLDYVFADDYMEMRRKPLGDQLQYLCGAGYLSGMFLGGGYGLYEGMRASAGKSTKLRLNAVLNATAKRGIAASNGLAVVALFYTFSEGAIYNYLNDDTAVNYALAGAATGAIYKCTRGLRTAGIWGAAGAATALATVYMTRQGKYGRGLQGLL